MTLRQRFAKRLFDITASAAGLVLTWPILIFAALLARWETGRSGIFRQERVGLHGQTFQVMKIRTMKEIAGRLTTVTTDHDPRITRCGRFFRKLKIDELPQLINVFRGEMSFVGPRPDVPQQMAQLSESQRRIFTVRPGITGPASLKYRDEEQILASQEDPEAFNNNVIFPDKVRINLNYIDRYRFSRDLTYIWQTLSGGGFRARPTDSPLAVPDDQDAVDTQSRRAA